MRQHLFVGRRFFGFSLHFALDLAEHDEFIRLGLLAPAIDLQIAQDERAFAVAFQKNKWIGREKFRRVKHVGIVSLAATMRRAGFVFDLLMCRFSCLRSIAMHVIPSEARDLTLVRLRQTIKRQIRRVSVSFERSFDSRVYPSAAIED